MPTEPINTIPIQLFLEAVKGADASKASEIRIDINNAKQLAYCLGIVMSRLNGDLERYVAEYSKGDKEVIEVQMDGGNTPNWK